MKYCNDEKSFQDYQTKLKPLIQRQIERSSRSIATFLYIEADQNCDRCPSNKPLAMMAKIELWVSNKAGPGPCSGLRYKICLFTPKSKKCHAVPRTNIDGRQARYSARSNTVQHGPTWDEAFLVIYLHNGSGINTAECKHLGLAQSDRRARAS